MKKRSDGIYFLTERYAPIEDFLPIDTSRPIELDLGCGDGDFAAQLAARYPERTILAADLLLGRVRKVRNKSEQRNLPNLKPLRAESRLLISRMIPDGMLDRVHLLCPDPWPKDRHSFRRLNSSDIMMHFARILKPGGVFHFSSDDAPYFEFTVRNLEGSGLFAPADKAAIADIADLKSDFERQWIEAGRTVVHTAWRKL